MASLADAKITLIHMKSLKIAAVLLVVSGVLGFTNKFSSASETIEIGEKAPLASKKMKGISGESLSLQSALKKNGLVVVFSCNTCPFVIGSNSFAGWEVQYNDLAKEAMADDVGFILVNSNEAKRKMGDGLKDMQERAKEKGYVMDYVLDKNSELADAFGAKTTPHVFLFDKKMNLQYKGSIDNSWNGKRVQEETYLLDALHQLVSGEKISATSTPPRGCSIKRK